MKDLVSDNNPELKRKVLGALKNLFIICVLKGWVPVSIRPLFVGAKLTALNKQLGDIRPIADGSTLRRLAAKCAGNYVKDHVSATYGHKQLGYGKSRGCKAAPHVVRFISFKGNHR